jgi:hypothetical protein
MTHTGIKYEITGNPYRGTMNNYHGKPQPLKLNKTPHRVDIAGLKQVDRDASLFVNYDGEHETKFTIGFEVEKNALHRGAVKEYELFCGFERDSSCGYEAVTHILPLLPAGSWRTKVYDMMHKATKIIDDRYSPSSSNCGGHVTIAVRGMDGNEIKHHVRKYSGLILAMFKKRLSNGYCNGNLNMLDNDANSSEMFNGWGGRYQLALAKGDLLEFRVVSRFQSVKQMMRRYELFYELLDYSINRNTGTFKGFLNKVKPIILSMYDNDADKVAEVFRIAEGMQKFINTGKVNKVVREWVDPNGYRTSWYDAELRREMGL